MRRFIRLFCCFFLIAAITVFAITQLTPVTREVTSSGISTPANSGTGVKKDCECCLSREEKRKQDAAMKKKIEEAFAEQEQAKARRDVAPREK